MAASARPRHDLVVIGASAGGVEALSRLVAHLPGDLDAAVCIVLHVMPTGSSVLPAILTRAGELPAKHAEDGEAPEPGTIYVAPPNSHLLVSDGTLRLDSGPQENGHRPAIDPLFRSAARSREHRVVGVVLSGTLDGGTAGLRTVRIHGGATLVQDPEDALYSQMPQNAIAHGRPHCILAVEELAAMLVRLVRGEVELQPLHSIEEETVNDEDEEHHRIYACCTCRRTSSRRRSGRRSGRSRTART